MSNGKKLVTLYMVVAYLLPMVGNELLGEHVQTIFVVSPLTLYSVSTLLVVYVLFLAVTPGPRRAAEPMQATPAARMLDAIGRRYLRVRWLFGLGASGVAAASVFSGGNAYRYAYGGITGSTRPLLVMAGIIITAIITADLFYFMFVNPRGGVARRRRRRESILLSLVLFTLVSGTADAIVAMACVFYALFPRQFMALVWTKEGRRSPAQAYGRFVTAGIVVCLIFASGWFIGETVKGLAPASASENLLSAGARRARSIVESGDLISTYPYYLIGRLSPHYYAFLLTTGSSVERADYAASLSRLALPLSTLLFRVDYLSGGWFGVERPAIGSLSRLNYLNLTTRPPTARQGTSPGLLASFNYVFTFPFNVLLCVWYLRVVSRSVDCALRVSHTRALSIVGLSLALMLISPALESPFDLLRGTDGATLRVLLLLGISVRLRYAVRSDERAAPAKGEAAAGLRLHGLAGS